MSPINDPTFQQILDAKVLGLACISDDMASSTKLVEMIKTIFAIKDKIIAEKNKEIEIKNNNIFSLSQQLNTIKFYKKYKNQEESSDENKTLKDHEIAEKDLEITEIKGVYSLTQIEEKMSPINDSNFSEISNKNYKDQEESSDESKTLTDHEIAEKDLEIQGILWQSEQNNLALLRILIFADNFQTSLVH